MTLKVRNRIMQLFMAFSLVCIITACVCFIIALVNSAITPPPVLRLPDFLNRIFLLKYSFAATMIAIVLMVLYATTIAWHCLKFFEATQSSEIIFFIGFMTACLCEGLRFLTPLFGLWSTFSSFLFFCGRILFMGRLLAPLSFVFAAICSSPDQRQDVERNITILFAIAIIFAIIVPLNTARITSAGTITWGFPKLFFASRLIFAAIASLSFWINGYNNEVKEYKKMAVYMLIMLTGYTFMSNADNFVFIVIGLPLLLWGTARYLQNVHLANS